MFKKSQPSPSVFAIQFANSKLVLGIDPLVSDLSFFRGEVEQGIRSLELEPSTETYKEFVGSRTEKFYWIASECTSVKDRTKKSESSIHSRLCEINTALWQLHGLFKALTDATYPGSLRELNKIPGQLEAVESSLHKLADKTLAFNALKLWSWQLFVGVPLCLLSVASLGWAMSAITAPLRHATNDETGLIVAAVLFGIAGASAFGALVLNHVSRCTDPTPADSDDEKAPRAAGK